MCEGGGGGVLGSRLPGAGCSFKARERHLIVSGRYSLSMDALQGLFFSPIMWKLVP